MKQLSDATIARLRDITEVPDAGGRYTIVRLLGRGGTGAVYQAEDHELRRQVALKVVASEHAGPAAADRMRVEAQTIAGLEHPGIVPLHDIGELPDGRIFYTMKLVRGHRLDHASESLSERLRIFLRICEAVAFAHARGVVHCDLKPQNIMTGEFGEVLVMDWGTHLAGTRGYMAPEHEAGDAVSPATDVFSLGRILAEMARNPKRPLAAIVAKATSLNAADRYVTARELGEDVLRYLEGMPLVAYRENLAERAIRWLSRNRALVTVIAAYLVMRVLIFLFVHR